MYFRKYLLGFGGKNGQRYLGMDIEASPPAPLRKKERGDNDVKIIGVGVIY